LLSARFSAFLSESRVLKCFILYTSVGYATLAFVFDAAGTPPWPRRGYRPPFGPPKRQHEDPLSKIGAG
jgi:hypothetical protein